MFQGPWHLLELSMDSMGSWNVISQNRVIVNSYLLLYDRLPSDVQFFLKVPIDQEKKTFLA